jgi:hypothetical protein
LLYWIDERVAVTELSLSVDSEVDCMLGVLLWVGQIAIAGRETVLEVNLADSSGGSLGRLKGVF